MEKEMEDIMGIGMEAATQLILNSLQRILDTLGHWVEVTVDLIHLMMKNINQSKWSLGSQVSVTATETKYSIFNSKFVYSKKDI